MHIPDFGFLATPASIEAAVAGGTTIACATPSAPSPDTAVAMLASMPVLWLPCQTCQQSGLAGVEAAHPWRSVMTLAEAACALQCDECRQRVLPVTVRGAVSLHRRQAPPPEAQQRPYEDALWHMKQHSAVGAAFTRYQTAGRTVQAKCKVCSQLYFVDYAYGQAQRLQLRAARDASYAAYANTEPFVSIIDLVHGVILEDIAAGRFPLPIYDWKCCASCDTDQRWSVAARDALTNAHHAAARLGWVQVPNTTPVCVPLGVAIQMRAEELHGVLPKLASGDAVQLNLEDIAMAVMFVIREAVAPLVRVSDAELKPLNGAPGLATLVGGGRMRFGSAADCAAAAGGCHVNAGVVIIASAREVRDSYLVAI